MDSFERLKGFHLAEVADFSSSRGIESEPAFVWWVPFNLSNRDSIIAAVIARTKSVSHKYGVQLPYTVQEEYDIDEANGNNLWCYALNKEMDNLKVAFDILTDGKTPPVHYHKASEI